MENQMHGAMPGTATSQISTDTDTDTSTGKPLATLTARFAITKHVLVQSNPAHGPVSYYATRWGMAKILPDLDAAEAFLIQIGGAE